MKKCLFCICLISFLFIQPLSSEEDKLSKSEKQKATQVEKVSAESDKDKSNKAKSDNDKTSEEETYSELPTGYRDISLGMDFEAVKDALKKDSVFGYRGERDISLLAGENRTLIATTGSYFIKRAWFQFYENKLYVIIIQMDTDKIDYYTIYSTLSSKYGGPKTLDPKKSVWVGESVSMFLERPLIIKYIDVTTFNSILEKYKDEKAYSDILREDFINEF